MKELLIVTAFFAICCTPLAAGAYWFLSWNCSARWEYSGFKSNFGIPEGCTIEVAPGKWIPEDRYREVAE